MLQHIANAEKSINVHNIKCSGFGNEDLYCGIVLLCSEFSNLALY